MSILRKWAGFGRHHRLQKCLPAQLSLALCVSTQSDSTSALQQHQFSSRIHLAVTLPFPQPIVGGWLLTLYHSVSGLGTKLLSSGLHGQSGQNGSDHYWNVCTAVVFCYCWFICLAWHYPCLPPISVVKKLLQVLQWRKFGVALPCNMQIYKLLYFSCLPCELQSVPAIGKGLSSKTEPVYQPNIHMDIKALTELVFQSLPTFCFTVRSV